MSAIDRSTSRFPESDINSTAVPAIWCPLRTAQDGEDASFERVASATMANFEALGFPQKDLDRMTGMQTGKLSVLTCAAVSSGGQILLSDWLAFALLLDDAVCDTGWFSRDPVAYNHLVINILDSVLNPERLHSGSTLGPYEKYAPALASILNRCAVLSPHNTTTIFQMHYRWLLGAAAGVSDRYGVYVRSLDEHLVARPLDGADTIFSGLIEICSGTWLSDGERRKPLCRAMTTLAGILVTALTDLPSFRREAATGSLESNIVQIIANEFAFDLGSALEYSCSLMEVCMERFTALIELATAIGSGGLSIYARNLESMVAGTIHWQHELPRYQDAYAPGEGALHSIESHRQFEDVPVPLSIRWCWNV